MNRLKKLKLQLLQLFPTKLPLTVDEFDKMIAEILEANDLPNEASFKHAIASAIMHLGPVTASKPKRFFAQSVRKAIANQVAYDKMKQLEKEEAERIQKEISDKEAETKDGSSLQSPT